MELLDLIDIGHSIITMDAMNTQRTIESKLIQKKADYVLPVKDNQKNLLEEIQDYFVYMNQHHSELVAKSTYSEVDAGHGRIEHRMILPWLHSNIAWIMHTWASWHVQNGTSLQELQQLGGWSSFDMVLRYAHLSGDHLSNAANRISNLGVGTGSRIQVSRM